MTVVLENDGLVVHHGDARDVLRSLPAESVHCVVTSPPYWGLRDYGTPGQIGLEASVEDWLGQMVDVCRELRRVLRADGTLWLNVGDAYNAGTTAKRKPSIQPSSDVGYWLNAGSMGDERVNVPGLKNKDLVGMPWRLAFALQADGWWLRRDIVWSKPNPMPESADDRPITAHEYVFLLTKSARYYYDAIAVREPASGGAHPNGKRSGVKVADKAIDGNSKLNASYKASVHNETKADMPLDRNLRSVWTIATQPYPGAHFATFPPKLVEPCILAGTSERGVCPDCGAPWVRVVESKANPAHKTPDGWDTSKGSGGHGSVHRAGREKGHKSAVTGGSWNDHSNDLVTGSAGVGGGTNRRRVWEEGLSGVRTLGWRPSCRHGGQADDLEMIRTPIGEGQGSEYHRDTHGGSGTGRRGLDRKRKDVEGTRSMFRWEQRAIAEQLRQSEHRDEMAVSAGTAFEHYVRTDRSGARAVPPELLNAWLDAGWVTWPERDEPEPAAPVPATVLDPFAGSGTTGLVAGELGRRAILIDLNTDYLRQAVVRATRGLVDPGGHEVPDDSLWAMEAIG